MHEQIKMQEKLEKILGLPNVYFQPPENVKLKYPCILYEIDNIDRLTADNEVYRINTRFQITYIDKEPNSMILELFNREIHFTSSRYYVADNLHHYIYLGYAI